MEDNISFSTFPNNKFAALAYLYVQNQDFTDASPSDVLDAYDLAYEQIQNHANRKCNPYRLGDNE